MNFLNRHLSCVNWPRLSFKLARQEALAALSIALVMVPQAVAYAGLAGMPLVTGLYACLIPALLAVMFGSANRISVGPAALTCVLISASLNGLAEPGSAQWVELAVWLALLAGLIQFGLGALSYGWLLNLISSPVLMGFTQAAALLIMASQLPALLGSSAKDWQIDALSALFFGWPGAFGLTSLGLLLLARKFKPRWPAIMGVVALSAVLAWALDYAEHGAVIGVLPTGLPQLYLPTWPGWVLLQQLALPALVIALVSFMEAAASARIECQLDGKRWDENKELIGQGLAKLASGLSGSFATGTSFSRSALVLYVGARSGWAIVFCSFYVLLALLLFMPLLRHVPMSVLAAAVIVAVLNLFQPYQFIRLWRISPPEAITAGLTFVITIWTAPAIYGGVVAGVLITLVHFLYTRLHPRIIEIGLHPDGSLRDRHLLQLPPLAPKLFALRMDAELDFAAASTLERYIVEYLNQHRQVNHVCLFAFPINRVDITGAETFQKLESMLQQRQVTLHISGLKLPAETLLRRAGCLQTREGLRLYRSDREAIEALQQLPSDD
ncbi:MAG: SulP family inorganic anion transporter [Burkholderiaceae bacterium]